MNLRDAQHAHEASLQSQYDRAHDDTPYLRDYTLFACTVFPDADEPETLTDYYAIHEGDDSDVPTCVPIGCNLDGIWTWGICGRDFDEAHAAKVRTAEQLRPGEVVDVFKAWLLKSDSRKKELVRSELETLGVQAA